MHPGHPRIPGLPNWGHRVWGTWRPPIERMKRQSALNRRRPFGSPKVDDDCGSGSGRESDLKMPLLAARGAPLRLVALVVAGVAVGAGFLA